MDRIELEPSTGQRVIADERPVLIEPPVTALLAVEDVHLPTPPALADALDDFYVGLWGLLRQPAESAIIYRANNVRLVFTAVFEPLPIQRDTERPLGIVVPSLHRAERLLIDREIAYSREIGIVPGHACLLLHDPAGNWVQIIDLPAV